MNTVKWSGTQEILYQEKPGFPLYFVNAICLKQRYAIAILFPDNCYNLLVMRPHPNYLNYLLGFNYLID